MGDADKSYIIIDENDNNSLFWEMTIKEAFPNASVQVCKSGYDGLEFAKKNRYDLFIASWEMQGISGLIFMQKLKQIFKYRHTPFLIFSQILTEEDLEIAKDFGIMDYLLKPFDKQRVVDKINAMLEAEAKLDNQQRTLRKIEDWVQEDKINEALKLINDVLKPGPNAARAYCLNGDIWARTEHLERAEKAYKESLKFDPKYSPAINGLGKLYLKMKKFDEAAKQFESLNASNNKNLERMICLGNAYLGKGDDKKAEGVFKQVKTIDTDNAEATEGVGKVEFQRGNFDLAARFFKESGKGDELASYFNNMGITLVNQGKYDDAIKLYSNAINVIPQKGRIHLLEYNVGLAYKKSNRFGDSATAFARSVIANPSYEKAYQAMALMVKEAKTQKQTYNTNLVQQAVDKAREAKEAAPGASEEKKPEGKTP